MRLAIARIGLQLKAILRDFQMVLRRLMRFTMKLQSKPADQQRQEKLCKVFARDFNATRRFRLDVVSERIGPSRRAENPLLLHFKCNPEQKRDGYIRSEQSPAMRKIERRALFRGIAL